MRFCRAICKLSILIISHNLFVKVLRLSYLIRAYSSLIWLRFQQHLAPTEICSLIILACKLCMTVISCILRIIVLRCPKLSLCGSPWALLSMSLSVSVGQSSSMKFFPPLTLCRAPQPCSTQPLYVRSCLVAI